jgi:dethiobiotin synthetase
VSAATYFIAGTDTGVGKTHVTLALLRAGRDRGIAVAGMKPVATGAEQVDGRWISPDALQIASASGQAGPYEELNPYCLRDAVSPNIAADRCNITIDIGLIAAISRRLQVERDLLLIEGTGGWHTPISARESMADIARALGSPVILVIGLRLGCLNHARLTRESIEAHGCTLAGWVANQIDPGFAMAVENLATLEQLMGAAPLAVVPFARTRTRTYDGAHVRAALARLLEANRARHWTRVT